MTLLAVLASAMLSAQAGDVSLSHEYVPDLSGDGTSFDLSVSTTGKATLTSHRWICPDGRYEGHISPQDLERLHGLIEDARAATPDPPPIWLCMHAPAFWMRESTLARSGAYQRFEANARVSDVGSSPLAQLFAFARTLAMGATWDTFSPSAPRSAPGSRILGPAGVTR